jgi:chromosome segregation ATPase
MNIDLLKQGLQQILQEDLSNRGSIAELRRNVFLQSSKSEEKEAVLAAKEKALAELVSEVDYFKNQIAIRDTNLEENKQSFSEERNSLMEVIQEKETQIAALNQELEGVRERAMQVEQKNTEVNRLSFENSNYASKIRELVEHIALLQEKDEASQKEINLLKVKDDQADSIKKENDKFRLEANTLSQLLNTEKEKNEKSNQENISLRSQVESGTQSIAELNLQLTKVKEENRIISGNISDLQNKLAISEITIRQLEEKQFLSNNEFDAMEKSIQEIRALNQELQVANFELMSKEQAIRISSEETSAVLREEITQLEELSFETIENLRSDNVRLSAELSLIQEQQKNLVFDGRSPQELFLEYSKLQEEMKVLLSNSAQIQSEFNSVNSENQRMKSSLNDAQRDKVQFQEIIDALEVKMETMHNQLTDIQTQNQDLVIRSNELNAINQSLSSYRENYISAQQKISELENTIRDLYSAQSSYVSAEEFNQVISNNGILNSEIESLRNQLLNTTDLSLKIQSLSDQNHSLLKEIEELKILSNVAAGLEDQKVVNDELHGENKRLSDMNELLSKRVDELEKLNLELGETSGNASENEKKITQLQMIADELNAEKIRLEELITDLKRELFKAEDKVSSSKDFTASEELANIQQQKIELEAQVGELLEKIAELSNMSENQKVEQGNLEKESNSVTLASVLAVSLKNKKAVKLKINELLREIDRCIAMLNAQS